MKHARSLFILVLFASFTLTLVGCQPAGEPSATTEGSATAVAATPSTPKVAWALAIHGGAGVVRSAVAPEEEPEYRASLQAALDLGAAMLAEGKSSVDVVEAVVRSLEDDPHFNAGKGAVFSSEGTNELDAAIMNGQDLNCGAVSGIKTVKNPITLARHVMEESRHVFLMGEGAEAFATETGVERVDPQYFFVQRRYDSWQKAVEREKARGKAAAGMAALPRAEDHEASQGKYGTVGAVAMDQQGNLAAATSTGGLTNKRFGRVGDVPIIGAGTYADNRSAAISCTGIGEKFIRNTVARNVAALMEYQGLSLEAAARAMIDDRLEPGDGGLIAVGRDGSIALVFNSEGMFRGAADASGRSEVAIF
jgi:beta-aspartyl-peptidase (threonine type)